MRKSGSIAAGVLISLALLINDCAHEQQHPTVATSIQGVWEYMEDDMLQDICGMSFFGERHFAFVVNFGEDSLSTAQHILAYSGTYVMQDSIVTATIHYAHNPALVGQNLRWIHGVSADTASYRVLNTSGEVVERGRVRRLE